MGIRVHEALEKLYRDLNVSKENNSHKGFRSGSAAKNT